MSIRREPTVTANVDGRPVVGESGWVNSPRTASGVERIQRPGAAGGYSPGLRARMLMLWMLESQPSSPHGAEETTRTSLKPAASIRPR